VLIVKKNSPLISILNKSVARNPVPIDSNQDCLNYAKIKSIKKIGQQNVYNMEVEDHHNFSVNGGLIVHNCIDVARYAHEDDMRFEEEEIHTQDYV